MSDSVRPHRQQLTRLPSLGFSRQEYWSGLPFPSPMHESEKWKWSCSVVPDSFRPRGLQPTRFLRPWDFPGKSTGVGCHCLLLEGGRGNPFQYCCLETPMDRGAWWATVHRVAKSQTWLKRLSTHAQGEFLGLSLPQKELCPDFLGWQPPCCYTAELEQHVEADTAEGKLLPEQVSCAYTAGFFVSQYAKRWWC